MNQQQQINKQEKLTRKAAFKFFKKAGAHFIKERNIKAHTDMLVDYKDKQFNVEIKVRNCNSDDYPDMLLTDLKVYHLFKDFDFRTPLYMVFYKDCTYIWNLSRIKISSLKRTTLYSNKVTMTDNPTKTNREFILLPLSLGLRYSFIYSENI